MSGLTRVEAIVRSIPKRSCWIRRTLPKALSLNTTVIARMPCCTALASSVAVNRKPPSPVTVTTVRSGCTSLGADTGGDPGAERAGEAGRQERSWLTELVREMGDERHLRDVLDDDRVVGQRVADGGEVRQLRLEMGDVVEELGAARAELGTPVGPLQIGKPIDEHRHHFGCVAVDAERPDAVAIELVGSVLIWIRLTPALPHCSSGNSIARADAEHEIDIGPHPMGQTDGHEQWIGLVEHTVAHAPRRHRRLQQLGESANSGRSVLGAGADPDQRVRRRRATSRLPRRPRRRRSVGIVRTPAPTVPGAGFGPHVCGHLDGDRSRCAGHQFVERGLDLLGRVGGVANDRGVLGDLTQHGGLVVELVEHARIRGRATASGSVRRSPEPARRHRRRSTIPPTALNRPGPGTTHIAVGRPVACAAPIAMYAQPCS